jgi:excisionase family DNA binding protein
MPELTPDDVMTVAEVAATLKLNQQTVRNWIDAGTLPALRVGRRVRIKRPDFDQLIADSEISTKVKPGPGESIWDGHIPAPVVPS